jgi:cobalamin biosynthesis Mg chelatase CobN
MGAGSIVCCLIVIASFILFVVNQTHAASIQQRNEVTMGSAAGSSASRSSTAGEAASAQARKGSVQRLIDEAAESLRSPFAGITSSSHSAWVIELAGTLLALLLYGVIVRYVMRFIEIRV